MTTPQGNPLDDPKRMGRGASMVRYAVARYLKDVYPDMRMRALNQWHIAPEELPSIASFTPVEVIEINANTKPVLGVEVRNTSQLRATELNEYGSMEYRAVYDVRIGVYLYNRTTEEGVSANHARGEAIRQRDDQTQIIRSCLTSRPSLGTNTLTARADTISITYPTPVPTNNNSDRWAISGEIAIDIVADEWDTLTALGTVKETGVDAEVLLDTTQPGWPWLGDVR